MNRYEIKIENINDDAIDLRFYSSNDCKFRIKRIKFYDADSCLIGEQCLRAFQLYENKRFKIITFDLLNFDKKCSIIKFQVVEKNSNLIEFVTVDIDNSKIGRKNENK